MMKIGFIGIGKMGNRMVSKLANGGHEVVVWNRTREKAEELKGHIASLQIADSVKDLVNKLEKPRIIWSMLPAGEATQEILDEIEKYVDGGDIVIDGGNAHYP